MIDKIQNAVIRKKIESTFKKHGLQLKHYLPGRIRLAMVDWRLQEEQVLGLLEEIKQDPDVTVVEFTEETGSILIFYNKDAINQSATLDRWKSVIEKYM